MARYLGPKQKIARRYGEQMFGFSKSLERKNYPPGQHGNNKGKGKSKGKRGKLSDYGMQLKEKQKAKALYGILERQFRKIFADAARLRGSTGDNLIRLLEARLDNTVYRMGISPTRRGARQLVLHKHVTVNGRVVNIPSFRLEPGDVVEVRESSKSLEIVTNSLTSSRSRFNWLEVDKSNARGKFLHFPERADVPENLKERMVVELYSR